MKTNPVAIATLIAWACSFSVASHAAPAPFQLFKIFNDSKKTRPRANEPYTVFLDGKIVDRGVTDSQGQVLTSHRKLGSPQEFVMRIFGFGTYSVRVDKQNRRQVDHVAAWSMGEDWQQSCRFKPSGCAGTGFYWIQLVGQSENFEGEPYSLTVGTQTYTGSVAEGGYIFLDRSDPPSVSDAMVLRLCAGPDIGVSIGTNEAQSSATLLTESADRMAECKNSHLGSYASEHPALNQGMPYVFSEWSQGLSPVQLAKQKQAEDDAVLEEYRQLARANSDPLAWLGALPVEWKSEDYEARARSSVSKITAEVSELATSDLKAFKCKAPVEVGPTPDMTAVENYIENFPASIEDPDLLRPLYAAAAKGNWLAVAQVYALMSQRPPEGNVYLRRYRQLQLQEWLQERKIGALYDLFGHQLAAVGYFSDVPGDGPSQFTVYAALRSSYIAQFEVGKVLKSSHNDLSEIGVAMQRCAKAALPAYAKLLE